MPDDIISSSDGNYEIELEDSLRKSGALELGRIATIVISRDGKIQTANLQAGWIFGKDAQRLAGTWVQDLGLDNVRGGPLFADVTNYLDNTFGYSEWEREYAPPGEDVQNFRLRAIQREAQWLILIEDVTSQRLLESRFKAILGTSRDGILVVDENGTVSWPNGRFGYFFGINWRQFKGLHYRAVAELIRGNFAKSEEFMNLVHNVEQNPDAHAEAVLKLEIPRAMTVQIFTRPISNAGGHTVGRVWFITDVTVFKEMEERLKVANSDLERRVRERTQQLEVQNRELISARSVLEKMNKSYSDELEMARSVQNGILPQKLPDLPDWDLAAVYVPTGQVSGDFYDVVRLSEDEIFVLIADVSGHGVSSALVTMIAKMAFQRYLTPGNFTSVADVMTYVNEQLRAVIHTDHYLTAFAAHIRLSDGRTRYCRVSHPYPYLAHADGTVDALSASGGLFLGMFDDSKYEETETVIRPGDFLLLYTDGLNETFNPQDQQYGRSRVEDQARKWVSQSMRDAVEGIMNDREVFASGRIPSDDTTLVALRRYACEEEGSTLSSMSTLTASAAVATSAVERD